MMSYIAGIQKSQIGETEYRLSALQGSNLLVVWIEFYGG